VIEQNEDVGVAPRNGASLGERAEQVDAEDFGMSTDEALGRCREPTDCLLAIQPIDPH
jgi:hypothetical protein